MNVAKVLHWRAKHETAEDQERAPVAAPSPGVIASARMAVLSIDAGLRETLTGISSALVSMHLFDDWAALLDALALQRCSIVLLDADRIEASQLDSRLAELNRLPASPVVIVAARGERARESMELLAAGKVPRLLLKPATPGAARLAIDYAIARSRHGGSVPAAPQAAAERRHHHRGALLAGAMVIVFAVTVLGGLSWQARKVVTPVEEVPALASPAGVPAPPPVATEELLAPTEAPSDDPELAETLPDVELLDDRSTQPILIEVAGSGFTEIQATPPESVEPAAPLAEPTVPAPVPLEIDRLLRRAEARLQAGELVRPQEDNAYVLYARAAAIDGADPRVADLRARLGEAFVAAVLQALEADDLREAELLLEVGSELDINAVVLGHLAAQLDTAYVKQQAERQAAREAGLLQAGLDRMREQAYIAPDGDSAAFYIARLRAENPNHPGLAAPWAALVTTLADNARDATTAGEFTTAEQWIEWLRWLDADRNLIETLSVVLASARRQHEFLRVPAQPSELQLVHAEPASYPHQALLRNVEGWVDVDFIVDRNGVPRDVRITAAEPAGIFDRSATNAIDRYRYQPFVVDSVAYERRVAFRLLFTLD